MHQLERDVLPRCDGSIRILERALRQWSRVPGGLPVEWFDQRARLRRPRSPRYSPVLHRVDQRPLAERLEHRTPRTPRTPRTIRTIRTIRTPERPNARTTRTFRTFRTLVIVSAGS